MNERKIIYQILLMLLFCLNGSMLRAQLLEDEWVIPVRGNSFITQENSSFKEHQDINPDAPFAAVGRAGLILKNDTISVASTYIYVPKPSQFLLSLNVVGLAQLNVVCGEQQFVAHIDTKKNERVEIGTLKVDSPQYIRIDFKVNDIGKPTFVVIRDVILSGLKVKPLFINANFNPTFGLCGVSVCMKYHLPQVKESEWLYQEIQIPSEGFIDGSIYGLIAFDGGSIELRNKKEEKRQLVFNVWDTADFDNQMLVPADYRAFVVRRGEDVNTRMLRQDGSGVQCVLNYDWKPNTLYRLLLHAVHKDSTSTDYSVYLYQQDKTWKELATVRRPHINFKLTGLHTYLENTNSKNGYLSRKVQYPNVWLKDIKGQWHSVDEVEFSNDDTGRRGIRIDFEGGVSSDGYYLKTGGFFSKTTEHNQFLKKEPLQEEARKNMIEWLQQQTDKLILKLK